MLSVTCEQRALYSKLQMVARGVSGRSTQPIQNNIYMEAADGVLTLVATDLEFIGVRTSMPCVVLEEGAITVPARLITDVAGRLPVGDVQMTAVESNSLQIRGGKSQFSIRGLPPDDFEQLVLVLAQIGQIIDLDTIVLEDLDGGGAELVGNENLGHCALLAFATPIGGA